jgi:hypothetical protein
MRDFFNGRKGQRMTLSQIRQYISTQTNVQLSMNEVEEAIKEIIDSENSGGIKYISNNQTVIVQG